MSTVPPGEGRGPRVLHVVVGHGLPTYFLNAVRSVRAAAPSDPLLIIDNASPSRELRGRLARLAEADGNTDVILRTANDVRANHKVGSLYQAYGVAFDWAIARGFDLLHLLQGDFQMMWWDGDLVTRSAGIFAAHPRCVNIQMQFLSRDRLLAGGLEPLADTGLTRLRWYGLTDTGLYHLGRWQAEGLAFGPSEQGHARRYLAEGFQVICHPWPTDAPIPWPAVIRGGRRRGREVPATRPYLLKPLPATDVARVKESPPRVWLEDVCIPWGWVCATPMWVTGLDSIDYWVLRYRDARRNGLTRLLPRVESRGVRREDRRWFTGPYRYRPSLFRLIVAAPVGEVARRLARLRRPRSRG